MVQPVVPTSPVEPRGSLPANDQMQRVTELTAPPVVGRFYLVPTVEFHWLGRTMVWPVFLPRHEDMRFFKFEDVHYHIDPRFVSDRVLGEDGIADTQRMPLARRRYGDWAVDPPTTAVWRRRKCQRASVAYAFGHREQVQRLRAHFAGQTCLSNRHGWVCPHQSWPMGSLEPDADGILTCPLHGLRIRAADGVVLPTSTGGHLECREEK